MLASSREPCCTGRSPGGINPSPTNLPKCPAKPDGRNHPGVRRAGCPHPAALRGGTNARGRIWNPPLRTTANAAANRENAAANPGNRGPALQQTPVGDDARIVPRTLRHRKVPGRDKSRPYDRRKARTQPGNGNLAVPQPPVGDDACIVPGASRRRKVSREGHGPPLQTERKARTNRGTAPSATNGRGRPHGFSFSSSR